MSAETQTGMNNFPHGDSMWPLKNKTIYSLEITMISKTQTGMNNFPHGDYIWQLKNKTIYTDEIKRK